MAAASPSTKLVCSGCGGPLDPPADGVRVRCAYCGTTNDVASAGAVKVAKKLEQAGIRVADRLMTREEIAEEVAARAAAAEEARRRAVAVAITILVVVGVLVAVLLVATSS